jgi:hypothetical protein
VLEAVMTANVGVVDTGHGAEVAGVGSDVGVSQLVGAQGPAPGKVLPARPALERLVPCVRVKVMHCDETKWAHTMVKDSRLKHLRRVAQIAQETCEENVI